MDCVNLPRLKFQISKVRCTHKQPPRQIRLHTCTWQAHKQHICTWQAHKVLPNWRIVMYGFFSSGKSPITSSQVKLCFLIGSVCQMSQITQDKLHLPVGSMCQMSQQIKCIYIQVADCRIHTTVPEPIAARFGRPLIVECLFNCQAWLHQHQSKSKLSHVNWYTNVSTKCHDPF